METRHKNRNGIAGVWNGQFIHFQPPLGSVLDFLAWIFWSYKIRTFNSIDQPIFSVTSVGQVLIVNQLIRVILDIEIVKHYVHYCQFFCNNFFLC